MSNTDRILAAFREHLEGQRESLDKMPGLVNLTSVVYLNPHGDEVVMRPESKTKTTRRVSNP